VQARKWKQSIKFEGKPIGEWLTIHEVELELSQQIAKALYSPNSGTDVATQKGN
jgi:hypothetical protein